MPSICVPTYAEKIRNAAHRMRAAQTARDVTAEAMAHHELCELLADHGMAQLLASAFLLVGSVLGELLEVDAPRH